LAITNPPCSAISLR